MKKIVALALSLMLLLTCTAALAEANTVKMGHVYCVTNGTNGFAMITVAMDGDVIVGAYIDEVQPMDAATSVAVPNSDTTFPELAAANQVLASKRQNTEAYSGMMAAYAGSTVNIVDNYTAIQNFCVGKTIAQLEGELAGKTAEETVDAVAGATLVNMQLYLQGIIEAAKAAQ